MRDHVDQDAHAISQLEAEAQRFEWEATRADEHLEPQASNYLFTRASQLRRKAEEIRAEAEVAAIEAKEELAVIEAFAVYLDGRTIRIDGTLETCDCPDCILQRFFREDR